MTAQTPYVSLHVNFKFNFYMAHKKFHYTFVMSIPSYSTCELKQ